MDVYGTQSHGPQKHSTDLQLLIIHIDYDKCTSDEEKVDTTTSTETARVSTVTTTVSTATATVSTVTSTTVSSTIQTITATSVVQQQIHQAYHLNPIVNDRLKTWFQLLWYQQVYQEYLIRLGMEHVLPTW